MIRALALSVALAFPSAALADPANTLTAMFSTMTHCLSETRLAKGSDITVRFSINRKGDIIGHPFYTHASVSGDYLARAMNMGRVDAVIDRCFPLAISDGLGGAVAGRPMVVRLRAKS